MTRRDDPEFIDIDVFEDSLVQMGLELEDKNLLKTTFVYGDTQQKVELIRCFCPTAEKTGKPSSFCNETNNTFFVNPNGSVNSCVVETRLSDISEPIRDRDRLKLRRRLRNIRSTQRVKNPLVL